ncbi:MAG: hypothetical protein KBT27_08615 [Prevotellaceae bacterium]|nr:hypothetical protein [Candidatus Faecinaster equi]
MSTPIKYSLYKDSKDLEATRLRSILLFNGKVSRQKRQDLITKAILSLILAENGSATTERMLQQLNSQFNLNYNAGELDTQIKKLYKYGLIESLEEPFRINDSDKKGRSYFDELERNTEALLDDILRITKKYYVCTSISNPDSIKDTIRKALSVFYGMNGYTFFAVQRSKEVPIKTSAVSIVKNEIKDERLSESVIRAIADVLEKPTEEQKKILTQWARAFVAMETMSLDPLLNNFKSKNFKEKEFIIDTDVVLYCLTSKARFSEDYRQMITKLKELGCKMYVAPEVVTEVQKHIDAANKCYSFYGSRILEYPDEMLYDKVGNVFIDDYVHIEREAEEKTPYKSYIAEFHDPEYPALLHSNLVNAFHESFLNNRLQVDTSSAEFGQLEQEVYNLTMQTPKAQNRKEEDNRAISFLDTYFYMAAVSKNEGLDNTSMLSGKTYILSDSTRALRAANNLGWQKMDVICHPNALMAILMEMGDVKSQETIINLFDNPFLAYVADSVWDEIEPLIKNGAEIKYKGFNKLRCDVEKKFDKLMTADMPEDVRNSALTEYDIYLSDMVNEGKAREERQQARIEQLEQENADLKHSLVKARSVKVRQGKKLGLKSSRNKKKRKK